VSDAAEETVTEAATSVAKIKPVTAAEMWDVVNFETMRREGNVAAYPVGSALRLTYERELHVLMRVRGMVEFFADNEEDVRTFVKMSAEQRAEALKAEKLRRQNWAIKNRQKAATR
jgi:hypothetical protein